MSLEQSRVSELESLLVIARTDQCRRATVAAEADPERGVASLREQKRLLEEQVATLQRQVDGLVQVGVPPQLGAGSLAGTWLCSPAWHAVQCGALHRCRQSARNGAVCDGPGCS